MAKQFLILHPYGGFNPNYWQSLITETLLKKGEKVAQPTLGDPEIPQLEEWMADLEKVIAEFDQKDNLIVLTHSLSCPLWIHFISRHPEVKAKKVYLVAPAVDNCGMQAIADFFPLPDVNLSASEYLVIGSDNDEYIPFKKFQPFADRYGIPFKFIPNVGHINTSAGFGPWPWMLEECLA